MTSFEQTDTETKVIDIVARELKTDQKTITMQQSFSDLGADSLDMFEIILKLEETFGMEIDDDGADRIKTVQNAVDYAQKHRTK